MHLTFRHLTLLLALLGALFFAPGSKAQATAPQTALDAELFYNILLGELSVQADDPGSGFALMLDAARKTQDQALYRRAVQIALQTRSGKSALMAAKAWLQDAPDSSEANRLILQIVLGMNQVKEALEPLRRALEMAKDTDRADTLWSLTALFDHASDKRLAAQTVQAALADQLLDPKVGSAAWAAIGRAWLKAADLAATRQAVAKAQSLDVTAERPALVALSLMESDPSGGEALVQAHMPHARAEFRMAYVKTLLNQQRVRDASQVLQSLMIDAPDYPDGWLVQALVLLSQGQGAAAEKAFTSYLEKVSASGQNPLEHQRGRSQAYFGLADIAQQRQEWVQADQWLSKVDDPAEALRASVKRAELQASQGQIEPALRTIDLYRARNQAELRLKRSAKVRLLREHGQADQAVELLQQALAAQADDTGAMYELAMLFESQGKLADMEHWLRQNIAIKPDDAQPYNALGYALADRNMRLDEAKQLIEQAVALSPDDPYIQDSLGWVEFRLGNYPQAILLLEKAFAKRPEAEIAAHLGEVLWQSQKRAKALEMFRQGMQLDPNNQTLKQTIERLNVSL